MSVYLKPGDRVRFVDAGQLVHLARTREDAGECSRTYCDMLAALAEAEVSYTFHHVVAKKSSDPVDCLGCLARCA